jgi:hypothetical protein
MNIYLACCCLQITIYSTGHSTPWSSRPVSVYIYLINSSSITPSYFPFYTYISVFSISSSLPVFIFLIIHFTTLSHFPLHLIRCWPIFGQIALILLEVSMNAALQCTHNHTLSTNHKFTTQCGLLSSNLKKNHKNALNSNYTKHSSHIWVSKLQTQAGNHSNIVKSVYIEKCLWSRVHRAKSCLKLHVLLWRVSNVFSLLYSRYQGSFSRG